jgi:hypothetical protein
VAAGNLPAAHLIYGDLREAGVVSAELYIGTGRLYLAAGEPAHALIYLNAAEKVAGRNLPEIAADLELARKASSQRRG